MATVFLSKKGAVDDSNCMGNINSDNISDYKMKITSPEYRILIATIILVYCMVITAIGGFGWYNPNESIIIALVGFASTLLGIGIVKKHNSFTNNNKDDM